MKQPKVFNKTSNIQRRGVNAFTVKRGCELADPRKSFEEIYLKTDGYPCNGCSFVENCRLLFRFQKEDEIKND